MHRDFLRFLGATLLGTALVLQTQGDEKKDDPEAIRTALTQEQEQLLQNVQDLQQRIEALSVRLEKSDRFEDRDRVPLLKKALTTLKASNLEGRLQQTATLLRHNDRPLAADVLARTAQQQKEAAAEMNALVTLFGAEDREMGLNRMVKECDRQLKTLQGAVLQQQKACDAIEKQLKKEAAAEGQKEATRSVKGLLDQGTRAKAIECPDLCGFQQCLREASTQQARAEADLKSGKPDDALGHQRKALDAMVDAHRKLGEQYSQARAEQIERLLSGLQTRCQRMFDMQTTVRNETVSIFQAQNEGGDRSALDEKSQQLADDEDKIALEAHRATRLVEEEGTTLALPEVFYQLRRDMIGVANRLRKNDFSVVTQAIQQDVLDTLRETTDAIKKARKDTAPPAPATLETSRPTLLMRTNLAAPPAMDPQAEMKVINGLVNRGNLRMDSYSKDLPRGSGDLDKIKDSDARARAEMLLREKQEFDAWKKRLPEVSDDGKPRCDRQTQDRERQDAHFRELTDALKRIKHQLEKASRSDGREKLEQLEEVLKFAETLKPDENRIARLLDFLASRKIVRQDLDRRLKGKEMAADVYATFTHFFDEERCTRNQEDWHEVTLRARDTQQRLMKQIETLKQLQEKQ
jgi:hypothetical protein